MHAAANEGKSLLIETGGVKYERIPIKTHIITDRDRVADVLLKYVKPLLKDGDIAFMSEKAVACTQKRAIRMKDIHPRPLAKFLCKFVYKTPYGIGLGIPETMEMALRECGVARILFAAVVSAIGKLFGVRGWFYRIAGEKARSIDGPCDCTIPPYNEYVVLGPLDPDKAAQEAAAESGCPLFCIVDLNDLGGNILGTSTKELDRDWLLSVLKDNPLGQSDEQTPVGIIRRAADDVSEGPMSPREWFELKRGDMIADLRRLVAIRSVAEPGGEPGPFGQGCRDVLDEMIKICAEHGIEAQNHEYYCGSAFLPGASDEEVGFWAHLDVVPESVGWQYPPFGGEITPDGFIIGRGVADNKNMAVGGLYLMLYFRDNGIPLKRGIRLFFGCSEECGMEDQAYYKERYKIPDYSIVADLEFPVCYGEKGILGADLVSPELSGEILELSAGLVGNMVADRALIRLKKTPELLLKLEGVEGADEDGESVVVRTAGRAAHAAYPEGSVNAIDLLAKLALEKGLIPQQDEGVFRFISNVCSDYSGSGLGIAASHEEFGKLTCIGGMLSMRDGRAVLNINIRYPYSEQSDVLLAVIRARCVEYGFTVGEFSDSKPSHVARDSEFVSGLTRAFEQVTGLKAPAYIAGGGTYARNLPNAVACGPEFPGGKKRPQGFGDDRGGVHQPDEALYLDEFITALEIYATYLSF